MPPILPLLNHHLGFLHRLHPRQWKVSAGPRPPLPFHPTTPHVLDPRVWTLEVPVIRPPTNHAREFSLPINTTNITFYPYRFPSLRNNPKHRYHPVIEFVVDLLRWIFHMFGGGPVRPKPPPDYERAQEVVLRVWRCLVFTIVALILFVLLLLLVTRVCVAYDRHQSRHGQVGVEMARREDAMIRACEKKGRKIIERMEGRRVERIWREEDKRQALRDEYLRRQSILQGKLPVSAMMREQGDKLGREIIEGAGEGPAPRPEMGRSTSKREERRGEGTQVLSEEEDTRWKSSSHRLPRGAEGRIGNSVWRSSSYKSIQRRDSEPQVFIQNRTFGLMGVRRNPSFKAALQDRLDDVFTANSNQDSVVCSLPKNNISLGRALSFGQAPEVLNLPNNPDSLSSPGFLDSSNNRSPSLKVKATTQLPAFVVVDGVRHNQRPAMLSYLPSGVRVTPVDTQAIAQGSLLDEIYSVRRGGKREGLRDEAGEKVRRKDEEMDGRALEGDMLPGTGGIGEVGILRLEPETLDSGTVHDAPLGSSASITTSDTSYHSAETTSFRSTASHAAHHGPDSNLQSSHHDYSNGPGADHPLLGAHVRSSFTILHTPSPTMHPITAQSSVERLEEGVRSRSSVDTLCNVVSVGRARGSIDTLHGAMVSLPRASIDRSKDRRIDKGVRSRASINTLNDAMVPLPRVSRERKSVDTLHEATASLSGASIEGERDEEMQSREDMVLLPRLSFEALRGWSPVEISDASGRVEEDRAGREDWEVEGDGNGKDGERGLVRRMSTCAQQ